MGFEVRDVRWRGFCVMRSRARMARAAVARDAEGANARAGLIRRGRASTKKERLTDRDGSCVCLHHYHSIQHGLRDDIGEWRCDRSRVEDAGASGAVRYVESYD